MKKNRLFRPEFLLLEERAVPATLLWRATEQTGFYFNDNNKPWMDADTGLRVAGLDINWNDTVSFDNNSPTTCIVAAGGNDTVVKQVLTSANWNGTIGLDANLFVRRDPAEAAAASVWQSGSIQASTSTAKLCINNTMFIASGGEFGDVVNPAVNFDVDVYNGATLALTDDFEGSSARLCIGSDDVDDPAAYLEVDGSLAVGLLLANQAKIKVDNSGIADVSANIVGDDVANQSFVNYGTVNWDESVSLGVPMFNVRSFGLGGVIVADDVTMTLNDGINNLYSGSVNSRLILHENSGIVGDVQLQSNATLSMEDDSDINGNVNVYDSGLVTTGTVDGTTGQIEGNLFLHDAGTKLTMKYQTLTVNGTLSVQKGATVSIYCDPTSLTRCSQIIANAIDYQVAGGNAGGVLQSDGVGVEIPGLHDYAVLATNVPATFPTYNHPTGLQGLGQVLGVNTVRLQERVRILNAIMNQTVNEGSMMSCWASTIYPYPLSSPNFVYSFDSAPSGATISSSMGTISWTPTDNGTATFVVRVTDTAHDTSIWTDTVSFTCTVNNVAPTGMLSVPSTATTGTAITCYWMGSYDPSSADTSAGFTYQYSIDGGSWSSGSSSINVTFTTTGTHTVAGRIYDKDGGYTAYSYNVFVTDGMGMIIPPGP